MVCRVWPDLVSCCLSVAGEGKIRYLCCFALVGMVWSDLDCLMFCCGGDGTNIFTFHVASLWPGRV